MCYGWQARRRSQRASLCHGGGDPSGFERRRAPAAGPSAQDSPLGPATRTGRHGRERIRRNQAASACSGESTRYGGPGSPIRTCATQHLAELGELIVVVAAERGLSVTDEIEGAHEPVTWPILLRRFGVCAELPSLQVCRWNLHLEVSCGAGRQKNSRGGPLPGNATARCKKRGIRTIAVQRLHCNCELVSIRPMGNSIVVHPRDHALIALHRVPAHLQRCHWHRAR